MGSSPYPEATLFYGGHSAAWRHDGFIALQGGVLLGHHGRLWSENHIYGQLAPKWQFLENLVPTHHPGCAMPWSNFWSTLIHQFADKPAYGWVCHFWTFATKRRQIYNWGSLILSWFFKSSWTISLITQCKCGASKIILNHFGLSCTKTHININVKM